MEWIGMGCAKMNKIQFYKRSNQIKKMLIIPIVVLMLIAAITPITFAGTEDTVQVTFTPTGNMDISVDETHATFGNIPEGTGGHTPTEGAATTTYTLTNSGSSAAHIWVQTNFTTVGAEWTLDGTQTPGVDQYTILFINNSGGAAYYPAGANLTWVPSVAGGGGTHQWGIRLYLGNASGSAVLDAQTTMINFSCTYA